MSQIMSRLYPFFSRLLALAALLGLVLVYWQTPWASGEPAAATKAEHGTASIVLGMGCFWGAEKRMAALPGITDVVSGYAGGDYPDPTYRKVLRREGQPGVRNHAEVVKVSFDPTKTSLEQVLVGFWENHDPTQGDRQGNDRGSNYRSAIYYTSKDQRDVAKMTRAVYQKALTAADYGPITTEIKPLKRFYPAENYHQDYLDKHPNGYCGLGGTEVAFPTGTSKQAQRHPQPLDGAALAADKQLVVFEAEACPFCETFREQILSDWQSPVPVVTTLASKAPVGWELAESLWATPTIVLFRDGEETARYTGYNGDESRFWRWLGFQMLDKQARQIAFEQGTERAYSGSLLDEKRQGTYVDPITGEPLFRSNSKFKSHTGWPSFLQPVEGAVTLHPDNSHGMQRTEVRSASSGIHLGHVFDDGPPPTGKRYCINSKVLQFVPAE